MVMDSGDVRRIQTLCIKSSLRSKFSISVSFIEIWQLHLFISVIFFMWLKILRLSKVDR